MLALHESAPRFAVPPRLPRYTSPSVQADEDAAIVAEGCGEYSIPADAQAPANDAHPRSMATGSTRLPMAFAHDLAASLKPINWLCRQFGLAPGRPILFSGYGGAGKTFIVQQLALCVAAGIPRIWDQVEIQSSGAVLHIDYEQTFDQTRWRYQRLAYGIGLDLGSLGERLALSSLPPMYLTSGDSEVELTRACQGRTLCIIDNLRAACPGVDENDSKVRAYLDVLTRVTQATGCMFVVIVHEGKGGTGPGSRDGSQKVRGSSAIVDAASAVVSFSGNGHEILTVEQTKSSMGQPSEPLRLRFADCGHILAETGKTEGIRIEAVSVCPTGDRDAEGPAVAKAKVGIVETLRKHGPLKRQDLFEYTIGSNEVLREAVKLLLNDGTIAAEMVGTKGAKQYRLVGS